MARPERMVEIFLLKDAALAPGWRRRPGSRPHPGPPVGCPRAWCSHRLCHGGAVASSSLRLLSIRSPQLSKPRRRRRTPSTRTSSTCKCPCRGSGLAGPRCRAQPGRAGEGGRLCSEEPREAPASAPLDAPLDQATVTPSPARARPLRSSSCLARAPCTWPVRRGREDPRCVPGRRAV